MENSLNFTNTMPVKAFMQSEGITSLKVARNPEKGTRFLIADGSVIGKAANNELGDDPQISRCNDGSEEFLMIHKASNKNVDHHFTL